MSTHPTTFADLEAAGWTPGAGASGHRFRYTMVGAYEVGAFNDGGGVYVERADSEYHIDTADACALATKIAALISGDINAADAALTEAGTVNSRLAADLAQAQTENAALRARLAERPAPPDPRDKPVKTSEEEAAERLWGALFTLGGGINRADFEGGIEGITDAVEEALGYNLAQLRKVTTERDRMESIALEQFRRRLSGA